MTVLRMIIVLLAMILWVQPTFAGGDPPASSPEGAGAATNQNEIGNKPQPEAGAESPEKARPEEQSSPAKVVIVPRGGRANDAVSILMREMRLMLEEIRELRRELAETRLRSRAMHRELDELRAFMEDHHEYGDDFSQYQAVKKIQEDEAKQKQREEVRKRRAVEKEERNAKRRTFLAARAEDKARKNAEKRYTQGGFTPLGLGVYGSKMAYAYHPVDTNQGSIYYDYPFVDFLQRYPSADIDYAHMTISGSVLNAADRVRNIGVAITFFDDYGNQVGHEIVQVKNARPDVPYPFTSTIDMALDRPFTTTSIYVLYADEVEEGGG